MPDKITEPRPLVYDVPEANGSQSTLLPMLIGGLVLILLGSLVVMTLV